MQKFYYLYAKYQTIDISTYSSPRLYTSLLSTWKLLGGITEPFFRDVAILLMDSHQCSFVASVEALYPVEHSPACRYLLSTNCR
jgi:hypothetical protein